jgi:lysophospholipase L1-like esterase
MITHVRYRSLLRSFALIAALAATAASTAFAAEAATSSREHWVASWGAAQMLAEGQNVLPSEPRRNVTLRQIVRLSLGGSSMRVRVSNAFGTEPLHVLALHVARSTASDSAKIEGGSDRPLTFNERAEVVIPAGAEMTSDAVGMEIKALSSLAITMQIEAVPARQTGHVASHATSYIAADAVVDATELPSARAFDHWYFLSGIDVSAPGGFAIVALGDSITDGSGSTTNANNRWPDVLAERLQQSQADRRIGVINAGIGGNRLLLDGNGPNALARFDRDVLSRSGIRYLIVLEGINDLGTLTRDAPVNDAKHSELVHQMMGAYREMIARARTHGITVIGATLMPFTGFAFYHPDSHNEADRQAVNAWIRTPGHFDAVIDLDKVTADRERPERLNPHYDSGDHIHPSPAGYRAIGEAISLELFAR